PVTLNRMLIELEIECLDNGGKNNGKIIHTYTDFERAGTARKAIKPTLARMVEIGIIRMRNGRPGIGGYERTHLVRLTYLPTWEGKRWVLATNEWLKNQLSRSGKKSTTARSGKKSTTGLENLHATQRAGNADKIRNSSVVKSPLLSRCTVAKGYLSSSSAEL